MTISSFTCPGTIHLGRGASDVISTLVSGRAYLLTGSNAERNADLIDKIKSVTELAGHSCISGEPEVQLAVAVAQSLKESAAEVVVAIGGGSVLDAAKAASALATNPGSALDYLEVVGKGQPLVEDPLPMVAMPTTFGTGSEVTKNAVLAATEHKRKVSLRDPRMVPSHAIVDPDLACGLPREVAAYSGIDALVHVCEAYVCNKPCKFLDPVCEVAIRDGFACIKRYCDDPGDQDREVMANVSLCGGLMIANAKLGAVHGFAGVIGGMYGAAHGKICAALFGPVFRANTEILSNNQKEGEVFLERYSTLAQIVTGKTKPQALPDAIDAIVHACGLTGLADLGVEPADRENIVTQARGSSSMKGNPITLDDVQLLSILKQAH